MNLCLIDPFKQSDVPESVEYYLVDPTSKIICSQFNRRGTLLACGSASGKVLIWDFDTKKIVRELFSHTTSVHTLSWSRNGKKLLTASSESLVLWDLPFASIEVKLELKSIVSVEFHPRDNNICLIVQSKFDPTLLNFTTGQITKIHIKKDKDGKDIPNTIKEGGDVTCASFHRKGGKIYVGDSVGLISVVDYPSLKVERYFKVSNNNSNNSIKDFEFSRNNRYMLVNSTDRNIRVYSLDGTTTNTTPNISSSNSSSNNNINIAYPIVREFSETVNKHQWKKCCFSSNNEYVIAGGVSKSSHSLFIWSLSGGLVKDLEGPKEGFMDVLWHPLRPIIISINIHGMIYVWTSYFEENWSSFASDFKELEENEEYIELEDEFDVKDGDYNDGDANGEPNKKKSKTTKLQESNEEQEEVLDVDNIEKITDYSSDEEEELFCFSAIDNEFISNVPFDDIRHPFYEPAIPTSAPTKKEKEVKERPSKKK